MIDESTTNSQITDAVTQVNTTVVGNGPAMSQSLLDTVLSDALGLGMYNAVSAQQNSQTLGTAAVAATCARLLAQPVRFRVSKPPEPALPLRPGGDPGGGSPPTTPGVTARRVAAGERAVEEFARTVETSEAVIDDAKREVNRLFPEAHLERSHRSGDEPGDEEA